MADEKRNLIDENKRLAEEAKQALLMAITKEATGAEATLGIERLAHAYALVIGAKWGHLPGDSASLAG